MTGTDHDDDGAAVARVEPKHVVRDKLVRHWLEGEAGRDLVAIFASSINGIAAALESQVMRDAVAGSLDTETLVLPFDVRDEDNMRQATQEAVAWRGVDVFVANAGVSQRSPATQTAMQVYRDIVEIDLLAQIAATQAFALCVEARSSSLRPSNASKLSRSSHASGEDIT